MKTHILHLFFLFCLPGFISLAETVPSIQIIQATQNPTENTLNVEVQLTGMSVGEWLYLVSDCDDHDKKSTNGWTFVQRYVLTDDTVNGGTFAIPNVKSSRGLVRAFVHKGDAAVKPAWGTPCDYLETTDKTVAGKQYFNTGHVLGTNDTYEVKFQTAETLPSTEWVLVGGKNVNHSDRASNSSPFYFSLSNNKKWNVYFNNEHVAPTWTIAGGTLYHLKASFTCSETKVTDILLESRESENDPYTFEASKSSAYAPNTPYDPLCIFRQTVASKDTVNDCKPSPIGTRLYGLKITHNDTLLHDYRPCLHPETGKPCLYDVPQEDYLSNVGDIDFAYAITDLQAEWVAGVNEAVSWGGAAPEGSPSVTITSATFYEDGPLLVQLDFANLSGGERLIIAYDPDSVDHGGNRETWPFQKEIGTLAQVTNGTYAIDGLTTTTGVVRAMLLRGYSGSNAPWGTTLAYLEETNSAYFNSNHILKQGDTYEARMRTASLSGNQFLMAASTSGFSNRSTVFQMSSKRWCIGVNSYYQATPELYATADTDYLLTSTFTAEASTMIVRNLATGTTNVISTTGETPKNTTQPLYIFIRNESGSANLPCSNGTRLHSLTIAHEGEMLHDYLPCLDTNGVVCLYDLTAKTNLYGATKNAKFGYNLTAMPAGDRLIQSSATALCEYMSIPAMTPDLMWIDGCNDSGADSMELAVKPAFGSRPIDISQWIDYTLGHGCLKCYSSTNEQDLTADPIAPEFEVTPLGFTGDTDRGCIWMKLDLTGCATGSPVRYWKPAFVNDQSVP